MTAVVIVGLLAAVVLGFWLLDVVFDSAGRAVGTGVDRLVPQSERTVFATTLDASVAVEVIAKRLGQRDDMAVARVSPGGRVSYLGTDYAFTASASRRLHTSVVVKHRKSKGEPEGANDVRTEILRALRSMDPAARLA